MEWKIGEIKQVNGEWYQCVESQDGSCKHCDMNFEGKCPIPIKECTESGRSDKSYVIFKKLEKIGEPYPKFIFGRGNIKVQRYKLYRPTNTNICNGIWIYHWNGNLVDIEIKQNKEDMEENKLNLKPFDLQKAKEGKPVCTRDGRKARIICFDAKGDRPIIALIEMGVAETSNNYSIDGKAIPTKETPCDLMMLPEKKEGWINVYALNTCYSSKEEAEANIDRDYEDEYVRTVKINWEE